MKWASASFDAITNNLSKKLKGNKRTNPSFNKQLWDSYSLVAKIYWKHSCISEYDVFLLVTQAYSDKVKKKI